MNEELKKEIENFAGAKKSNINKFEKELDKVLSKIAEEVYNNEG